jgi:hypothetical protein
MWVVSYKWKIYFSFWHIAFLPIILWSVNDVVFLLVYLFNAVFQTFCVEFFLLS